MLLLEMLNLASGSLDDTFVRTLWRDHLPQYLQIALASATSLNTSELNHLAVKINDILQHTDSSRVRTCTNQSVSHTNSLEEKIVKLTERMEKLEETVSRSRSRSRQCRNSSSSYQNE